MTDDGERKIRELHERIVKCAREKSSVFMANAADSLGFDFLFGNEIDLMERVECPSCGMNGAVFTQCGVCGGPACDNCRNKTRTNICAECDEPK